MADWRPIALDSKLYENVDEANLGVAHAALENAWQNDVKGHSRFFGIEDWIDVPGDTGRMYLHHWRGDLIAVSSFGNVYRIDRDGNVENVTGVPVSGGNRPTFARTPKELGIAAGGQIIRFAGEKTEILSEDAPLSTHIGFVDNYMLAAEINSGLFYHSEAGEAREWDPLDVFAANGKPDDINALIVTDFDEVMISGRESIEQWERLRSGDTPFVQRYPVGEGVSEPYAIVFADNAVFCVNDKREVVRFSAQTSVPVGTEIAKVLEKADDWSGCWMGGTPNQPLHAFGQRFVVLQLPNATTPYGTKGLTYAYDLRNQRWFTIYGWDEHLSLPTRWPAWSHWPMWDRTYVGGEGKIGVLSDTTFSNFGAPQRMLGRTGHMSATGAVEVINLRARLKRGIGGNTTESMFSLRVRRDNGPWSRWMRKSFGRAGQRQMYLEFGPMGVGETFMFEYQITDDCEVELAALEAQFGKAHF